MTAGELEDEIAKNGSQALLEVIQAFEQEPPPATPQDHSQMTLAPKIELADAEVHWDQPAQKIMTLSGGPIQSPAPGAPSICMDSPNGSGFSNPAFMKANLAGQVKS